MVNSLTLISRKDNGNPFRFSAPLLLALLFVLSAFVPLASGQTEPAVEPQDWLSLRTDQWNQGATTALAPDSEELFWIFEAPPHSVLGWDMWYGGTAVVDHVVYAGHSNGLLYAIDESSGSVLWTFQVDDYDTDFPFPILSSPTVDVARQTIYLAADGLYAIDMNDGSLKWKFDTEFGYEWWASPNFDDNTIYMPSVGGYLFAINPDNGQELWRFETGEREYNPSNGQEINKEDGGAISATPAVGPEYVYIVDWDENLYAVTKDAGELVFYQGFEDTFPGTNTPMEWGPVDMAAGDGYACVALDLTDNMLFIGDTGNNFWALSMDQDDNGLDDDFDGKIDNEGNVIWKYEAGDLFSASASIYDGKVYVGAWDETLYAFDPVTGNIEWQSPLHGTPYGSQAAADGLVIAPTFANEGGWVGYITAYDATTGNEVWSLRVTDPLLAQPSIYNDKFIIGDWFGGQLIAVGENGPKPDLFVEDLSISEETSDGERIVYATVGNKAHTVRSSPYNVTIYVDDKLEYKETFEALDSGDIRPASVRLDMGGGKHDIKVEVTQQVSEWYHIAEVNFNNNEQTSTVGGVVNALKGESPVAFPLWFILGLLIGFGTAWFLVDRGEDEDGEDDGYRQPVAHIREVPAAGAGVSLDHELAEGQYITSEKAKRYHRSKCPFAQNIPRKGGHIVTREEAERQGKKPCQCTRITTAKDTAEDLVLDAEQ